jgi:hypothetical protein
LKLTSTAALPAAASQRKPSLYCVRKARSPLTPTITELSLTARASPASGWPYGRSERTIGLPFGSHAVANCDPSPPTEAPTACPHPFCASGDEYAYPAAVVKSLLPPRKLQRDDCGPTRRISASSVTTRASRMSARSAAVPTRKPHRCGQLRAVLLASATEGLMVLVPPDCPRPPVSPVRPSPSVPGLVAASPHAAAPIRSATAQIFARTGLLA